MHARNVRRGVRRAVQVIAVIVLASTVGGLAYHQLHAAARAQSQVGPHTAPSVSVTFDYQPTLLVVGDTYARGVTNRRLLTQPDFTVTYPYMVADKMGWNLALDAQGDTGFVTGLGNASPPQVPFIDRLDRNVASYHVDYVLIDGGRCDLGEPPERVVAAAGDYISNVHTRWPAAKIVIVLPTFAAPDVAADYSAVAQGLTRAAESVGAYVIDPVAQGWYHDVDVKQLVGRAGGVHLNQNGATYYADKIIENLKQMFDSKPTVLVVGDSFAAGVVPEIVTYPQLVADKLGWNLALDAQGGTGFVRGDDTFSPPHMPFIDRLDRDTATYRYRIDYILIDGGRNDLGLVAGPVVTAADEYIRKVHSYWPAAKIIIVLPAYVLARMADNYPILAEGFRRTADSVGAYVIDPVAQGWYRDIDLKPLIGRDGIHFNGKGNAYCADKIIENLKQIGLAS